MLIAVVTLVSTCCFVPVSANTEVEDTVEVKGFQRIYKNDGTFSLRVVAGLSSSELTGFGMIVKCKDNAGIALRFDIKGEKRLSEIFETVDGAESSVSAAELGAESLYTAVVEGIPQDMEFLSIEVVPYCIDKAGMKIEGNEKIFIVRENTITVQTKYKLVDVQDKIKVYGRSANFITGIDCDFSGSGIEFNAELSGDVSVRVNSSGGSYYTLYIDGERQEKRLEFAEGTAEYVIAEDLAQGTYNFKLIKQTQVEHSLSTFMSLGINGKILDKPQDNELLIEFIGDSITCGYALYGYPTPGVENYRGAKYMDATRSYAYLTAQALGADHSFVSVSGWAILPSSTGGGCIPNVYQQLCYKRGTTSYEPARTADIVVIHLGTNDLYNRDGYESDFVNASKEFIGDVREKNPGAKIVWAYGSMMSGSNLSKFEDKVEKIVGDLGGADAGLYMVKLKTDTSGGHSHPSVSGHVASAQTLTEFIRTNCID